MKPIYFLLTSLLIVASCTQPSSYLEMALEAAGENRGELERVLTHYKDSTLKRRAEVFLREISVYCNAAASPLQLEITGEAI
ncbi:MAG: DUF1573 domain-containing protein [Mediterranea massiliensis]|nr:DUF1573 domain-containing protein [Mediterranea massiliensis]